MTKILVGNIDFTGRSVERIALQGEIIGCLTISEKSGVTFKYMKEHIVNNGYLEIPDFLAAQIELCAALTQLEKEDGTIMIVGKLGDDDCLIQIQHSFFAESRH